MTNHVQVLIGYCDKVHRRCPAIKVCTSILYDKIKVDALIKVVVDRLEISEMQWKLED